MSNIAQKIFQAKRLLDSISGGLLFALTIVSLPMTAWILKPSDKVYWEMPTLIMSADGSEVVVWTGNDRVEIRNSAKRKAEEIVSCLFANELNQDRTRIGCEKASKAFIEKSTAYSIFRNHSHSAITLSETTETSFTPEGAPLIDYLEEHKLWVVEIRGIHTHTTTKSTSIMVTVKLAFKRSNGVDPLNPGMSLKNRKQQSIVVSHMEVSREELASSNPNAAH